MEADRFQSVTGQLELDSNHPTVPLGVVLPIPQLDAQLVAGVVPKQFRTSGYQ
jgi:hypothetical protein